MLNQPLTTVSIQETTTTPGDDDVKVTSASTNQSVDHVDQDQLWNSFF